MVDPSEFYIHQIATHTEKLQAVKKKLTVSSVLRLVVFLTTVIGIYLFWSDKIVLGILIFISLSSFLLLVLRHSKISHQRDLLTALISKNETELQVLKGNYETLPNGEHYKNPQHFYSEDIDLFGNKSFFQYLNRTELSEGSDFLAQLLLENEISGIEQKQKAIEELANIPEWRLYFSAVASLLKTEVSTKFISKWMLEYKAFVPKFMKPIALVFSSISILLIVAYFSTSLSGYVVAAWFGLGLLISGKYLSRVNQLVAAVSGIQSTFQQFEKLIDEIEKKDFSAPLLKQKKAQIHSDKLKASEALKKFARHLDALDQRSNMIFGIFGNGFLLWDIYQSQHIEKWIATYGKNVQSWFEAIIFFDAYNALGNFAFNHPTYVFPSITNDKEIVSVKKAGHPLLNPKTMIRNDFKIDKEQFFIITGANMAGKSTFLRTVSLLLVMGNTGLPVCAEQMYYRPIKLITSMRTTDSLTDDESYFFSELKRLKFIVDQIQTDEYFIILDEILKGTNSTDKAIGSKKFVEKLVSGNSTGIIATHDLSLCELENELPDIKNYYFDAEIINDELYFDYTLKKGICKNMNASFLLRKMKIID